jgi:hypothetical protein
LSGLRRRSLSFLIPAVLALLVAPQLARAETSRASPATQPAITSTCGKTIDEKLAVAQTALRSNGANSSAGSVCMLEAMIALNDRLHELEQGHTTGELRAPVITYPLPPFH